MDAMTPRPLIPSRLGISGSGGGLRSSHDVWQLVGLDPFWLGFGWGWVRDQMEIGSGTDCLLYGCVSGC